MNYKIVEAFLDNSQQYYRVRVIINNETQETFFFKFDHYPTQEEVNNVVEAFLSNNQNMTS